MSLSATSQLVDIILAVLATAATITAFFGDTIDKANPSKKIWGKITRVGYIAITLLLITIPLGVFKAYLTNKLDDAAEETQTQLAKKTAELLDTQTKLTAVTNGINELLKDLPNKNKEELQPRLKELATLTKGTSEYLADVLTEAFRVKTDSLKAELTGDFQAKIQTLKTQLEGVTTEFQSRIQGLKTDLMSDTQTKIQGLKSDLTTGVANEFENKTQGLKTALSNDFQAKVQGLKTDLTADITKDFQSRIQNLKSELTSDSQAKSQTVQGKVESLTELVRNTHPSASPAVAAASPPVPVQSQPDGSTGHH